MKTEKPDIEQRIRRFQQSCRDAGIKLTHQRLEIFREVAQTGDHPDAEMVHARLLKRVPAVSLDTVYRTLWMLKDLGVITTLGSQHHRTRFDANLDRHHHFICRRCGLTQDFYSDDFDGLPLIQTLKSVGFAEAVRVEVVGICSECASFNKQQNNHINRRYNHE